MGLHVSQSPKHDNDDALPVPWLLFDLIPLRTLELTFECFKCRRTIATSLIKSWRIWMDTKSYSCRSFIHPPRFHGLEQSSHYSGKKKKKGRCQFSFEVVSSAWTLSTVASVNKSHPCFSVWSRGHQHTARALSSHAANSILCPSCKLEMYHLKHHLTYWLIICF